MMAFTIAGKPVGRLGFGLLSLTNPAKNLSFDDAIPIMKAALDAGANFWDGADHYGPLERNSLHLLHAYFTKYPEDADKVVVSMKSGFDFATRKPTVDAASLRACIDRCLEVADGKYFIDVFTPSRLDRSVPVEETVGAIAEYVQAGKIGSVGLSECSAASIRSASRVTTIAAAQVELSLFQTSILQNGLREACKKNDIPIIAYSPLSRGFLTGQIRQFEDLDASDFRRHLPRFQPGNFENNLKLVEQLKTIAARKGCTSGQVALAWCSHQSDGEHAPVVPIPGSSTLAHLEETLKLVHLTDDDLRDIDEVLKEVEIKGGRYPAQFEEWLDI